MPSVITAPARLATVRALVREITTTRSPLARALAVQALRLLEQPAKRKRRAAAKETARG